LATARDTSKLWFINWPLQFVLHFYRLFDFKFAQNVDQFIANSATTAARIHKFYRRDSVVINPPIDIPATLHKSYILNRKSFFLTGGRLARAKRYDIAIHACNLLKLPLKVFGRDFSGHLPELQKIAGPTIEFVGEVTQEEKTQLFSQAQAYIFASDNEDFGMVSVEAQGHGCPVIGYNCGGIAETVIDGQTGVLFDELTPTSCARAIERLQKIKIEPTNCTIHAQNFSQESFVKKISQLVT
jgi:glycosyltransferase involved in cell wall biosynthesis